jgi:hypothetical protein
MTCKDTPNVQPEKGYVQRVCALCHLNAGISPQLHCVYTLRCDCCAQALSHHVLQVRAACVACALTTHWTTAMMSARWEACSSQHVALQLQTNTNPRSI